LIVGAEVTVFYASNLMTPFSLKISKIDRLMPIVGETEEFRIAEIRLLNQELNFLTDRVARFDRTRKKFALIIGDKSYLFNGTGARN